MRSVIILLALEALAGRAMSKMFVPQIDSQLFEDLHGYFQKKENVVIICAINSANGIIAKA